VKVLVVLQLVAGILCLKGPEREVVLVGIQVVLLELPPTALPLVLPLIEGSPSAVAPALEAPGLALRLVFDLLLPIRVGIVVVHISSFFPRIRPGGVFIFCPRKSRATLYLCLYHNLRKVGKPFSSVPVNM
jgi:hypothetical protein